MAIAPVVPLSIPFGAAGVGVIVLAGGERQAEREGLRHD